MGKLLFFFCDRMDLVTIGFYQMMDTGKNILSINAKIPHPVSDVVKFDGAEGS
jgi:hypothetical protein